MERSAMRERPNVLCKTFPHSAIAPCGLQDRAYAAPYIQAMTDLQSHVPLAGFVEKTPLERYAAPDKPSLIGMSRAELADAFGTVGVPEAQRRMRVEQVWNWL